MSKWALFFLGFLLIALGLALVIKNWETLVVFVKVTAGVVIALVGLVMMFAASLKR